VAPLGNTKEDDYYRNDSMKYCRHEEKKREEVERAGATRNDIGFLEGSVRGCEFCGDPLWEGNFE